MRVAQTLIAILLLASASATGAQGTAQIRLLPRADVGKPFFALGDIADIESADGNLQQRLAVLRIGQSPRMGYRLTVPRSAVEDAVGRDLPSLRHALRWTGAQRVIVHGGGQPVSGGQITEIASRKAYEVMRPAYQALELRPVIKLDDLSVPLGEVSLAARLDRVNGATKRLCVPVELSVDGQAYRIVQVWFSVRAMQKVWVAKHDRAPGEWLQQSDFVSELRDVASLTSAPVSTRDQPLRTLRLRQRIEAGAVLLSTQVEARPAVLRNEPVAVKLVSGGISIETSGVALDDARVGQYVRVRNSASGEAFSGRVVDEHSVVIEGR
jgi:flagella basal body P-ring formation protein FlgA